MKRLASAASEGGEIEDRERERQGKREGGESEREWAMRREWATRQQQTSTRVRANVAKSSVS